MKMLIVGLAGLLFSLSSINKTEAQVINNADESTVIAWENKCPVGGYYDYKHQFSMKWRNTVSVRSENVCAPVGNYKQQAGRPDYTRPEEVDMVPSRDFALVDRDYKHNNF